MKVKQILEALNKGWLISEVVNILASGENDEGRGYMVTLMEPENYMLHKFYLPYSEEAEALLSQASLPGETK